MRPISGKGQSTHEHGGHDRDGVGFKQVSRHTSTITDVITHVVSNDGWIARVVFRNTGFDFTDQVSADVGALGENATTQTGKNGNERGAEGQADHGVQQITQAARRVTYFEQHGIKPGDTQQPQTDHQHAGNGAATEGNFECGINTPGCGLCSTHVGAY